MGIMVEAISTEAAVDDSLSPTNSSIANTFGDPDAKVYLPKTAVSTLF